MRGSAHSREHRARAPVFAPPRSNCGGDTRSIASRSGGVWCPAPITEQTDPEVWSGKLRQPLAPGSQRHLGEADQFRASWQTKTANRSASDDIMGTSLRCCGSSVSDHNAIRMTFQESVSSGLTSRIIVSRENPIGGR
jgi:hypothetical protein